MFFKFLTRHIVLTIIALHGSSAQNGFVTTKINPKHGGLSKGFNTVLFLADSQTTNINIETEALASLNVSEVAKVVPCTLRPESSIPSDFSRIIKHTRNTNCDCNKLVQASISSLLGWARNAAGMATAVVSVTTAPNDAPGGFSYYSYNMGMTKLPEKTPPPPEDTAIKTINNPFEEDRNDGEEFPRIVRSEDGLLNVYPAERKLKFNEIRKFHRGIRPEDFVNVRRVKRRLIVEPENSQIFEIDGVASEAPPDIVDIPVLRKQPESIWDLLGIMSAVRNSFFSNYFTTMQDPVERMMDEERGLNFKMLGKVRKPSIFQVVKTTMHQVLQQTDNNGFLVIVMGGNFSEISEPRSEMFQSIKFVLEITNLDNTLVIVSPNCPEGNNTQTGATSKPQVTRLPVYAVGNGAELLSNAKELYDIPIVIKEILSRTTHPKVLPRIRDNLETANKNSANVLQVNNYENEEDDDSLFRNAKIEPEFNNDNTRDRDQILTKKRRDAPKINEPYSMSSNNPANRMLLHTLLLFLILIPIILTY